MFAVWSKSTSDVCLFFVRFVPNPEIGKARARLRRHHRCRRRRRLGFRTSFSFVRVAVGAAPCTRKQLYFLPPAAPFSSIPPPPSRHPVAPAQWRNIQSILNFMHSILPSPCMYIQFFCSLFSSSPVLCCCCTSFSYFWPSSEGVLPFLLRFLHSLLSASAAASARDCTL